MPPSPRARRPESLRTVAPLVIATVVAILLCAAPAASARSVPQGFFGVMADGVLFQLRLPAQVAEQSLMVRSGVESERLVINWAGAQPYETFARIPPNLRSSFRSMGGVPTNLGNLDRKIGGAAAAGIQVLPVVAFSPRWAAASRYVVGAQPRHPSDYARFLRVLVQRYGPRGVYWRSHPAPFRTRVRQWQIWNEEDLPYYWTGNARHFAPGYVSLLRSARSAIKSVDPGAKVVLGGLTSSISWPQVWDAFDALYKAGARGLFDVAAVHPYTRDPENVIKILDRVQAVMQAHGDGARAIAVTEMGWSSSLGKTRNHLSWEVSPSKQARNLTRVYDLMAANRRRLHIVAAYWYTWLSNDHMRYWSDWSGLRKAVGGQAMAKPAFGAYQHVARRYEGCHKQALASRCG